MSYTTPLSSVGFGDFIYWYTYLSGMARNVVCSNTYVTFSTLTCPTLSANQNDYNPSGANNAAVLCVSATTPINLTGIANGTPGRIMYIINISTNNITIPNNSSSSLAQNRVYTQTGSSIVLGIGQGITLAFNGTNWSQVG